MELKKIIDRGEALVMLGLDINFTQLDLIRSYKKLVKEYQLKMEHNENNNIFSVVANDLYNCSIAYLTLRNEEMVHDNLETSQPLLIFTDASVYHNFDYAAFAIVVENLSKNFSVPEEIIKKYNIIAEDSSSPDICILTGFIKNIDVNTAEIVGIIAAIEVFQFHAIETVQKIILYTDSLSAKKVLTDDMLPPDTEIYSELRQRFKEILSNSDVEVIVKKIQAHAGHLMNEIADTAAKNRCALENNI